MKTFLPKVDKIEHKWYLIDASDKVLGRLCTQIAGLLRGKHKPIFTPFFDTGDYVVVINAEKIKLTGNKPVNKNYKSYSGYPSGLKTISYKKVMEKDPRRVIYHATKGMLPKNKLRKQMLSRLKIYIGSEHPHQAQKPELIF
jgi:large subunit ribosomal protein L13